MGSGFVACNGDEKKEDDPGTDDVNNMGGGQSDGSDDVSEPNPSNPTTPTGPQCDEPGGRQCTGSASGIACADDSTDAVTFVCATGEKCEDGDCVGICTEGETECVGESLLRVCVNEGCEWVSIPCQDGTVCDPTLDIPACGVGGGLTCTPGTVECQDGELATCREDGSGWDTEECPGTTVCEDGACRGSVCTVGEARCDSSAEDIYGFFEGGVRPNFSVIQRCVDGESWQVEPCGTEKELEACVYTDFGRAEAAQLRADVNRWLQQLDDGLPNVVTPEFPSYPAGSHAECVPIPEDCNPFTAFFESPAEGRECADPNDPEGNAWWDGYTECVGLMPFSTLEVQTTECVGASVCSPIQPTQGCQATACDPGEAQCFDENIYRVCFFEGSPTPENFRFNRFFECPDDTSTGGVAPGMCEDSGETPNRSVLCSGTEVEIDPTDFVSGDGDGDIIIVPPQK